MNGKKAKNLRRWAERVTVGKPKVCYDKDEHGTVTLGDCTRKEYKRLKKAAKLSK